MTHIYENGSTVTVTCECGATAEVDADNARRTLEARGWMYVPAMRVGICPDCLEDED